jgi:hypothetical protein
MSMSSGLRWRPMQEWYTSYAWFRLWQKPFWTLAAIQSRHHCCRGAKPGQRDARPVLGPLQTHRTLLCRFRHLVVGVRWRSAANQWSWSFKDGDPLWSQLCRCATQLAFCLRTSCTPSVQGMFAFSAPGSTASQVEYSKVWRATSYCFGR